MTSIETPSMPKGETLPPVLAARLPRPYSHWRHLSPGADLENFAAQRAQSIIARADASLAVIRSDSRTIGIACWRELAWDSRELGFGAGRVEFLAAEGEGAERRARSAALLHEVSAQCRRKSVRYLTARVDAGETDFIHALENAGFELIDGIQTFTMTFGEEPWNAPGGLEIRTFQPGDLAEVLEIARTSYIYDRFHADPALTPETADRINESWIRNSCLGTAADAVIVAADGNRALGYVTCKIDAEAEDALGFPVGIIVMVATGAAARRRGVARTATLGALRWFQDQGVRAVEVGTQLRNVPASRLYESCGFRLGAAGLTFRKVLD